MFLFDGLKSLLPKINCIIIDNHAFRLHYKVTVGVLIAFVILATSREHIGEPIACMHDDSISEKVINQFCWVNGTHSIPSAYDKVIGAEAVMFYFPRYLWKLWEGGKMKMLLLELYSPIMEEEEKNKKITLLHNYFANNLRMHNGYLYRYVACEFINFVNILGQIYLTDRFLGWEFLTFGSRVMQYVSDNGPTYTDPMIRVFPRLTKCTFYNHGRSGTIQFIDALCVLPLNIVNEKIYIFLWFWFMSLAIITGVNLIYRLVTLQIATFRVLLLRARAVLIPISVISTVVQRVQVGDWFVLYLLSKNMHHLVFAELMERLYDTVGKKPINSKSEKEYL
uniref:Innexin n=1 Tax=Strigamia maritima TaxID=126957 RepID=T1JM05_STRMM